MPFRPCRHLFTDGHQCGSPALRGEPLCFNHHSARRPLHHETLHGHTRVALPEPLDLHAVQRGLAELLRLTAAGAIDLPLAAALHRQLSTAAQNLARIERSEARADARAHARHLHRAPVTDYTNHPILGTLALETPPEIPPQPEPQPEPQPAPTASLARKLTSSPADPPYPAPNPLGAPRLAAETCASDLRPIPETTRDLQTQPPSNEDLETSPENLPEPPAPENRPPLPDPVHRFTLPPVIENRPSQEALATAELHYAQALEAMAQGIHTRAQTRAKLHAQLFPLVDDTENDHRLLDTHPQLHTILQELTQNEANTQASS